MLQIKFLGKFISLTIGNSNKNATGKKSVEFKFIVVAFFGVCLFIYVSLLFGVFVGDLANDVNSRNLIWF